MIRRLLAAVLALLLSAPAWAGATRVELLASAAQIATGNGGGIAVGNLKELTVYVDLTAISGTAPLLDVWLQSSSDGGTNWYDMLYEAGSMDAAANAVPGSSSTWSRDVLSGVSATSRATAIYKSFGDLVRVRWVISGTTPSFTFSVKSIGKS